MKSKFITLTLILCAFSIIGCKKKKDGLENKIEIALNKSIDDNFQFDKINYTEFPVFSYKQKYPRFYQNKLEKFKGIPKLDSFLIVSKYMQITPYNYELYKNKYKTRKELNRFKVVDTVSLSKNEIKYSLNAVSGFLNGEQVVIADANNNYDFSDDKTYTFKKDFSFTHENNPQIIDSLPIITFKHQVFFSGKVINIERKIKLYPYSNSRHQYLLRDGTLDSISNKYTLMLKLKDYAKGTIKTGKSEYIVALQGRNKNTLKIIIKPDSIKYEKSNLSFQWNFEYRKNDTVQLDNKLFKIDSITNDVSKMILTKLSSDSINLYGYRIGKNIKDYSLIGLDKKEYKISDSIKTNKPYTILDFWGTWCTPCKALTPELKRLHQENISKINMISIAFDENVEDVIKYVDENSFLWPQAFVDMKNKNGSIIDKLKIKAYPTLILIDRENKILYRGSGYKALKEIEKLIKN